MTPPNRGTAEPLPVCPPTALPVRDESRRWLVDKLWPLAGVGIVGGQAKSYKTFMALELAVSVASGTPCLGAFDVCNAGPVLVYAAEDSLADIRVRLEGLCRHRGIGLDSLDLGVITVDRLRLDHRADCARLDATVATHRPLLLVLDPFVRLCRAVDENSANDVSAVLGELRALQRRHQTAVLLVHHARKSGNRLRPGLALRGSGDFFAWTDTIHYLLRADDHVRVTVEHRSARAPDPFRLRLLEGPNGGGPHLQPADDTADHQPTSNDTGLRARLLDALADSPHPLSQYRLRQLVEGRNLIIARTLHDLEHEGLARHTPTGWTLGAPDHTDAAPGLLA